MNRRSNEANCTKRVVVATRRSYFYAGNQETPSSHVSTESPESKTLFTQAMEMLNRNNVHGAMNRLEAALQLSPDNAAYLSHYGLCVAIEREDFASAIKICEQAVKMAPDDPITRVNLGKIHRMRGENATAHGLFIQAWKVDKRHPSPAAELSRMGIRRPPVLAFLPRSHWLNIRLGKLRALLERGRRGRR